MQLPKGLSGALRAAYTAEDLLTAGTGAPADSLKALGSSDVTTEEDWASEDARNVRSVRLRLTE